MFYNAVLATWGELFLKGEKSQKAMLKLLIKDIKRKLIKNEDYTDFEIDRGLFIFHGDVGKIIRKLKRVFGIYKIYPALEVEKDLEKIKEATLEVVKRIPGKRFKLKVIRADKTFPLNSLQIAQEVGKYLEEKIKELKLNKRIDLKEYDTIVKINIRKNKAYIYFSEELGPGGLPYGSEGKGLIMFSAGFDSTLTTIFALRRGVKPLLVYFNPFDDFIEESVYKVYEKLKEYDPDLQLISIPFSEVYLQILTRVKEGYRQIVLKIVMHKLIKELAKFLGYECYFVGENIGQKSSQTLKSLLVIDKLSQVDKPISCFRPVSGLDKYEVIDFIRRFELYDVVEKVKEVCSLERKSKVFPEEEKVRKELEKLSIDYADLIRKAKSALKPKSYLEELEKCENYITIWKFIKIFDENNLEKLNNICIACKKGTLALAVKKALEKRGIKVKAMGLNL